MQREGSFLTPLFNSDDLVREILTDYNTMYLEFMHTAEGVAQTTPSGRVRKAAIGEYKRFAQSVFVPTHEDDNIFVRERDEILASKSRAPEDILRAGNISLFLCDFYAAQLCYSEVMAMGFPLTAAQKYLISVVLTHFQSWETLVTMLVPVVDNLIDPYRYDAHFRLGIAYKKLRMYPKALEHFGQLLGDKSGALEDTSRNPTWITIFDVVVEISHVYFLQGNIKSSFQQIDSYPRTPSTVQQIVFLCLCSDEIDTGLSILNEFEFTASSSELLYLKGRLQYKRGLLKDAFATLSSVITMDMSNHLAWCALGNIYMRMNQLQDAITCYQKAIISDNDMTEAWLNLICCFDLDPVLRERNKAFVASFPRPPVNTEHRRRKRDEPSVPIIIEPNDRDRFPPSSDLIDDIFCNEIPCFSPEILENIEFITGLEDNRNFEEESQTEESSETVPKD